MKAGKAGESLSMEYLPAEAVVFTSLVRKRQTGYCSSSHLARLSSAATDEEPAQEEAELATKREAVGRGYQAERYHQDLKGPSSRQKVFFSNRVKPGPEKRPDFFFLKLCTGLQECKAQNGKG